MALIGEMQYLTIGGNTYSLPSGGGGSVTSVAVSNATNGGLSVSGSPISSSGTITIGHSNVLSSAQTTQAVYPIKIDKNGHISAYGSAVTISDTKNTAGSTDSNSKLFLIGATSQAANPQTYSHDTAYVGTDGCLYSNSNKVLVEKYGIDSTGIVISPYAGEYGSIFSIFCNRNDDNENIHNGMQLTVSDSDVNITDMNDERAFLTVYARSLYPNGNVFITGLPTPTQNDQAANKKYVDDSINALDGSITGTAGAGKTLTAFSQTNGKITATFGNISITKSQISDFPTIPTAITNSYSNDAKSGNIMLNDANASSSTLSSTKTSGALTFSTSGVLQIGKAHSSEGSKGSINLSNSASSNLNYTTIVPSGTAARTITLPNATGTVALTSDIPSVNNATLTIQKNGTTVNSFTANASSNVTANITVPTKTSDLTNDSGFINSIKTINNQSLIGSGDITVSTTAAQIIRWTESA